MRFSGIDLREMLLPTTLDSLRPGRHAALQFIKPVQQNANAAHARGVLCFAPA
jgi:hypothetical protein